MNIYEIGKNAGTVWQLLSDHRDWSYGELKQACGLRDRELNAAIGWLAREGKIEIDIKEKAELFHQVRFNAYF